MCGCLYNWVIETFKEWKGRFMKDIALNKRTNLKVVLREIYKHRGLYMILVPVLIFYLVFMYKPMYGGAIIAFKDFNYRLGIMDSPWAGFKYFEEMFKLTDFWKALKKTHCILLWVGSFMSFQFL